MTDVLGWRRKFGVLGPSTNTIVQPDFEMMRPVGVTNHYSRIFTPNAQAVSNETFTAGTELIGRNVLEAVRSVMTSSPDYLVMGMSAVTFYGGAAGADGEHVRRAGDRVDHLAEAACDGERLPAGGDEGLRDAADDAGVGRSRGPRGEDHGATERYGRSWHGRLSLLRTG